MCQQCVEYACSKHLTNITHQMPPDGTYCSLTCTHASRGHTFFPILCIYASKDICSLTCTCTCACATRWHRLFLYLYTCQKRAHIVPYPIHIPEELHMFSVMYMYMYMCQYMALIVPLPVHIPVEGI